MNDHRRQARDPLGSEGSAFSEYAIVVGLCGLVISLAIVLMGKTLVDQYSQNRQVLIAPVP